MLLLEAGGKDDWFWIDIPVGYLYTIGNPRTDWCFKTEPDPGLNGRSLGYARGKVLGGCSSINAMVYMRGQKSDYDHWAALGNRGWSWDEVLPLLQARRGLLRRRRRIARRRRRAARGGAARALGDPRRVARGGRASAASPKIDEFNRGDNFGNAYFHMNQRRGVRWSATKAWLRPALGRPNLKVITNAHARKRRDRDARRRASAPPASSSRSQGAGEAIVEGAPRGDPRRRARIGSPQILQLSGVGPGELLRSLGIPVVHELPGVGENLHDHLQIRMMYKVQGPHAERARQQPARQGVDGRSSTSCSKTGPLTMPPSQLGAFAKSDPAQATPNIEWHVQPLSLDKFGDPLHPFPAITPSVCNLRPTSRGWVRIKSTDPDGRTRDPAELPLHARGPQGRRRRDALHAPHHGRPGAREVRAGGMAPGPARSGATRRW